MTLQETFDFVVNALRAQGCKSGEEDESSTNNFRCLYRGPNGIKCAAGHLIPDELYAPVMEDTFCDRGIVGDALDTAGHDKILAQSLQYVHDDSNVENWEEGFRKVAEKHNLVYTPVAV